MLFLLFSGVVFSTPDMGSMSRELGPDGDIPLWLTAGPFEQPIILFQGISDADSIGESSLEAYEGKREKGAFNASGFTSWRVQSIDAKGYLDFNETIGWDPPGNIPEKIRDARAAYAYTQIIAESERSVFLLTGSNARLKIWLNGKEVFSLQKDRKAVPDEDTVRIALKRGTNSLLFKVGNSYKNYYMPFWGGIDWGWGFYARFLNPDESRPEKVIVRIPVEKRPTNIQVESAIFFRKAGGKLLQELAVTIDNRDAQRSEALLNVTIGGNLASFTIDSLTFGENRRTIEINALQADREARFMLQGRETIVDTTFILRAQPRYDLHFMMSSHMDIGYTHPQPVGEERHLKTLDEVVQQCETDPAFRWTIENLRIVEAYER